MILNKLPSTTTRSKKRVGRGYGSGKGGHTASRGQKGQKSRGKLPLLFEGSKQRKSLIRRTPFLRGKLRNKPVANKPLIINLKYLNVFSDNEVVDLNSLIKKKLISPKVDRTTNLKILGDGELTKKLTVKIKTSLAAKQKITKAGGVVQLKPVKKQSADTTAKQSVKTTNQSESKKPSRVKLSAQKSKNKPKK